MAAKRRRGDQGLHQETPRHDPAFPAQTVDYDVEYYAGNGTWNIMSTEGFVGATAFNVVIDPAQVDACTDRIFADGFGG